MNTLGNTLFKNLRKYFSIISQIVSPSNWINQTQEKMKKHTYQENVFMISNDPFVIQVFLTKKKV